MTSREASTEPLLAWFRRRGGELIGCSVVVDALVGTKVVATARVPAGDPLISVPQALTLSYSSALAHGFAPLVEAFPQLAGAPDEILAAHLCAERRKGEASEWAPYLAALPQEVDAPLYWGEEEMALLDGTTLQLMVGEMQKGLRRDFDNIHAPLVEYYPELLGGITFDDYCWAMTMIFSRAFSIEGRKFLVPVIDSFNHQPGVVASIEDVVHVDGPLAPGISDTRWHFRAAAAYELGDECLGVYGRYCNAKLLFSYGFTLPEEAAGQAAVDFWVKPRPSDPAAGAKRELLARAPTTASLYSYDFEGTLRLNAIAPQLLWVLRIVALAPEELGLAGRAFSGMIHLANERKAYEALRASLVAKQAELEATAQRAQSTVEEVAAEVAAMRKTVPPVQAVGDKDASLVAPGPTVFELDHKRALRQYNALVVLEEETLVVRSCVHLLESWLRRIEDEGEAFLAVDMHPQVPTTEIAEVKE